MKFVHCLLFMITGLCCSPKAMSIDYYVNSKGNDQWSGTIKLPDSRSKNGPFKTLERAKQAIKALKQNNAFKDKVTVHIAAGHYFLSQTLKFDLLDSGLPGKEIVWQGESGGEVVISGGIPITCKKQDDKLWECPLKHMPVNKEFFDTERIKGNAPKFELYVNEQKLELARWPDQGWGHIKIPLNQSTQFSVMETLPAFKGDISNAQVHIFPGNDWYDQYIGLEAYNPGTNTIKLSSKTQYPLTSGSRFYVKNIFSALDAPGEWFYDQQNAKILFISPNDLVPQKTVLSSLTNIVIVDGSNFLKFENLTMQHSAGTGVLLNNANQIILEHLNVYNIGGKGIEINGGQQVSISNSNIHHTGGDAVNVLGGDNDSLQVSGHIIYNNSIHNMGLMLLTYSPGVRISGVGTKVTHNLLAQGAGIGILINGNEHLIEKNELHHFCMQASDCGAILSGRNWQWRGNIIRNNHIHDVIGYGLESVDLANNVVKYSSPAIVRGIYLDDAASGFEVVGNIIENTGHIGLNIGGGRDNKIYNNYFKTSGWAIMVDDRWTTYDWTQNQKYMDLSPYKSKIWRDKYPDLAVPMHNYKWPEGNRIERNIIVSTQPGGLALQYFIPVESTVIKHNLVWSLSSVINVNYNLLGQQKKATVPWKEWLTTGVEQGSIYADPCVTISNNKMTTCPTSAAKNIGFIPLPNDIGLISN
jgi:hypothetical protein